MNRTKPGLILLLCLMLQSGIRAQQSASQGSAGDHLKRANEFAGSGNLRGAIGEFRAAIRLEPSNANAHWGLAKALDTANPQVVVPNLSAFFLRSKMKDALKEYRTAINLDAKLRNDGTETAERHVQQAYAYLGRDFGHWYAYPCGDVSDNLVNHCMDDGAAEYRIALLLDPDYVPAHVALGEVLAKFHKADEAMEEFRAALRLDPQSAQAHLGLGKSFEKKGKLKDALQEYGSALSLEEGKAKYEKLSAKLGIKKEQSQPPGTKNNIEDRPLARQPLSVPAKAIEPVPESKMLASEHAPDSKKTDPEDMLRSFKSYYIKSETIYMHRETLQTELQKRGEFTAWELTATEDSKAADVVITITLPFLTWEWNYRMVYQPTGAELDKGKVSAAVENTAAPQLAAMIVKRIREVRPSPASFQEANGTPPTPANSGVETGKSWKLKYLSGSMTGIPKDTSVTLTVNHEWITVRASKTDSFSVAAAKVTTVASGTQIRKAKTGWEDFWDTQCCGDGGGGAALLIAPVFLAGEGILAPVKTTYPFVNIYWQEDGVMRSAYFSAGAGDAKSLLAEVSKVPGINVVDLQELMRKRKGLITEQYYSAPVVVIKRKVNVGWGSLATGTYRLISVLDEIPNVTGFAEVYFFPIRDSLDLDTGIQALAKFERRTTRLEGVLTSVSYREQNGIVMLDQIETSQLILRFTPIPLGFAK